MLACKTTVNQGQLLALTFCVLFVNIGDCEVENVLKFAYTYQWSVLNVVAVSREE